MEADSLRVERRKLEEFIFFLYVLPSWRGARGSVSTIRVFQPHRPSHSAPATLASRLSPPPPGMCSPWAFLLTHLVPSLTSLCHLLRRLSLTIKNCILPVPSNSLPPLIFLHSKYFHQRYLSCTSVFHCFILEVNYTEAGFGL